MKAFIVKGLKKGLPAQLSVRASSVKAAAEYAIIRNFDEKSLKIKYVGGYNWMTPTGEVIK